MLPSYLNISCRIFTSRFLLMTSRESERRVKNISIGTTEIWVTLCSHDRFDSSFDSLSSAWGIVYAATEFPLFVSNVILFHNG